MFVVRAALFPVVGSVTRLGSSTRIPRHSRFLTLLSANCNDHVIVVITIHVVVGLMVISSVELVAFVAVIVGMPIAVSSHGRIALTTVSLGLTLTTDPSLLAAWVPYMRAPSVRRCCTSYPHETDSWHSSVDGQLPRRACKSSGSRSCDDRDHNERIP